MNRARYLFLRSSVSVTFLTAIGLIGTIRYATVMPPTGAIVLCSIIAVVGVLTIWYQAKDALERYRMEEEAAANASRKFNSLTPDQQRSLLQLLSEVTLPASPSMSSLEPTGFVVRDRELAIYSVHPNYVPLLQRIFRKR